MLNQIHVIYDYLRDSAEPLKPKLLIGAALLYLLVPNDLLPDWFGLLGFTDDFVALAFVWGQTRHIMSDYRKRCIERNMVKEEIIG